MDFPALHNTFVLILKGEGGNCSTQGRRINEPLNGSPMSSGCVIPRILGTLGPMGVVLIPFQCASKMLLWRPVLAKPELLVFCGPESGVARLPRNLGFVLAILLVRQLSCRSLSVFSVDRRRPSSSGS